MTPPPLVEERKSMMENAKDRKGEVDPNHQSDLIDFRNQETKKR